MISKLVIIVAFTIVFLKGSVSQRLHEQIYSSIEGGNACFRRLNGTHQAGCTSPEEGAVGVIHFAKNVSDAEWLTQNATAGPYMVVISTSIFDDVIEIFMEQPKNIAGILLFEKSTVGSTTFTHDSKCPNEYSAGPGSTCSSTQSEAPKWNQKGSNLLRRDIPFTIFFLPESRSVEIKKMEQCYERYNLDKDNQKGRPLCSVQLNSFMFAAVNAEVCMRRSAVSLLKSTKFCDPLGDNNVYYSLFARPAETESAKTPVILVTARIDTASLFDGVSPGTASSVVGMVTLIAAAATLAKMIPNPDDKHNLNVLWTLFNGESFDYIGSQRVAYDLSHGKWPPSAPLVPTDIPLHLELGQLGGSLLAYDNDQSWPLNVFTSINENNLGVVTEIVQELTSNTERYNMSMKLTSTNNLPPSSLHSFRRILKNATESGNMTEILIADHEEEFTNMFYNSALDTLDKIGFVYRNISIGDDGTFVSTDELITNSIMKRTDPQVKVSLLANSLALTLYKKVAGTAYVGNISTSAHLVDEMLYCFLKSQACRLLLAADYANNGGGEDQLPEKPASLYVGVSAWSGTAPVFAGHLLALLTGLPLKVADRSECEAVNAPGYSNYWLKGWNHSGVCIQTTMNFSQALSPAFVIPDYDYKSGEYSTWTESVWQTFWARMFVSASGSGARIAAGTGFAATALAAIVTYWVRSRAHRLFGPTLVPTDAATGILRTVNC